MEVESKQDYQWLDAYTMPNELHERLRLKAAKDLGFESVDALLDAEHGDLMEMDSHISKLIAESVEQYIQKESK